jgi:RimJ/RimL family protein N-acetyltransferase
MREEHGVRGQSVVLRPVRVDDAEATLRVVREIAAEGGMFLVLPEELRTVPQQQEFLAGLGPDSCFVVAEVNGEVVGFVDVRRARLAKLRHTAELGIGLTAAYRNRGIGSLLLRAAENWARQVGGLRLHFGVFATNARAIAAYQKCGYAVEGCHRRQVREGDQFVDEYWMGKWLG